jgi:hypothetical protein
MAIREHELLDLLEKAAHEPAQLPAHIDAFLRAYWALSEQEFGEPSPLLEVIHELGDDLQDYPPPDDPNHEPTLLHDRDALARIRQALTLTGRQVSVVPRPWWTFWARTC